MLLQIYYNNHITADILWRTLRQIYYGRFITADTLQQIYCIQQKQPYLSKFTAPESLDCFIRICLLQRMTPKTPLDRLHCLRRERSPAGSATAPNLGRPKVAGGGASHGERSLPLRPQAQAPLYIFDIHIYI